MISKKIIIIISLVFILYYIFRAFYNQDLFKNETIINKEEGNNNNNNNNNNIFINPNVKNVIINQNDILKSSYYSYYWLSNNAIDYAINEFKSIESNRSIEPNVYRNGKLIDMRSSSPFITSYGFRQICYPNICDDDRIPNFRNITGENCEINLNNINDGSYKQDDLSQPDVQDRKDLNFKWLWKLDNELQIYYNKGVLKALHSINTYWDTYPAKRPPYLHCVPLGIETREYPHGKLLSQYINAMEKNKVLVRKNIELRPWLLISFEANNPSKPDRIIAHKQLIKLGWKNHYTMNHQKWLEDISWYRFTICPHGHGLDTHRITEVLLMGGIPVILKSSITSCYDNSDNTIGNYTRGKIPIVVVNSWNDVTPKRLENEWNRIIKISVNKWDWHRLFISHWIKRLNS